MVPGHRCTRVKAQVEMMLIEAGRLARIRGGKRRERKCEEEEEE
jgi:hypothetical protein